MTYTSNLDVVIKQLSVTLKGIADTDPLLQDIAVSLAGTNTRRIHNEGKDVKEGKITYKFSRKTPTRGAYSKGYATKRSKKGRQISKVDFSFTGKLSKEFQAAPIPGGWGVGFITATEIPKFLEEKFGNVWGVTASDQKIINRIVTKAINKKIRG